LFLSILLSFDPIFLPEAHRVARDLIFDSQNKKGKPNS
jgi:hypothetical protein